MAAGTSDRLEVRGTTAVLWPAEGGIRFLTASELREYRATGKVSPFRDELTGPGLQGLRRDQRHYVRVDQSDRRRK